VKRRRSPKEIWQELVDEAGEAEIERAASVSVEQAEKELAEAGFDVAAERAKASAFLDALAGRISQTRMRAARPTEPKPK
jgi:recombinational DNA repair ATPase RecF